MIGQFALHEMVLDAIREQIRADGDALISGTPTDYPQYRYLVGKLAGLAEAAEIAEETLRKIQQS